MVKFRFLVMIKALIGYGGHAREVMCQMGTKLPCFVDDVYVTEDTLPLSSLDIKQCKNYIKSIDECLEFFGHLDIEDYEKCNKLFDIKTKILE